MGNYTDIITELSARMAYHVGEAKILDGVRWVPIPRDESDGRDSLPAVRLNRVEMNESAEERTTAYGRVTVTFEIGVAKGGEGASLSSLVTLAEKVMDAIETNTSGVVDLQVAKSTINSVRFRGEPSRATQIGLYLYIEAELETVPFLRGSRRSS